MSNYFEGWYYKIQNQEETIAFIPGIARNSAFIQIITDEKSYNVTYDYAEFHKGSGVRIAKNHFSARGISLSISNQEVSIKAELIFHGLTGLISDAMGFFKYFNMECKHDVISLHHDVNGFVRINGRTINFDGGTGYIEMDSGRSFPKSYVWLQSNDFPQKCCVMVSIADIPFMGINFRGLMGIVWYEGIEYRLATYNGAKIIACTENNIIIKRGRYRLEAEMLGNGGHKLFAPQQGAMVRTIKENPSCMAKFKFYKGRHLVFDFESPKTSFEMEEANSV